MSSKVKQFLADSKGLLGDAVEPLSEFAEVLKQENIRQVKDQLAAEVGPLLTRLQHIEQQQSIIIGLLKRKLDLDGYEKEIMDLLKSKLAKE